MVGKNAKSKHGGAVRVVRLVLVDGFGIMTMTIWECMCVIIPTSMYGAIRLGKDLAVWQFGNKDKSMARDELMHEMAKALQACIDEMEIVRGGYSDSQIIRERASLSAYDAFISDEPQPAPERTLDSHRHLWGCPCHIGEDDNDPCPSNCQACTCKSSDRTQAERE